MRKPPTPCQLHQEDISGVLRVTRCCRRTPWLSPTLAVHTHEGHMKRYPPLFTPSFPNRRRPHLMPTAPTAVQSLPAYARSKFSTPDLQTHPPLPFLSLSLTLHVTSDRRSEFKVDRRCNVPIPATLGWRSRASNDIALTFRHWSRSSDCVRRSRSESSRGRAQPRSAFVRATQLPRALRLIYVSRVCRYSVNRTPHLFRFHFACPDPPTCVPTAPNHSGRRAHAPSTLTRANHRTPWPNAVYTTAFVALFQREMVKQETARRH